MNRKKKFISWTNIPEGKWLSEWPRQNSKRKPKSLFSRSLIFRLCRMDSLL